MKNRQERIEEFDKKVYEDISVGNYYCDGYLHLLYKHSNSSKEEVNQLNTCSNLIKAGQNIITVYHDHKIIHKSCKGCFKLDWKERTRN